jgi:methionyl-tRNA synthetase
VKSFVGPSVEVKAVVIRACRQCGGKREFGKPCETCGTAEPAQVKDLGVIASKQRSRWKRLKWHVWGYPLAQRRIKAENKRKLRETK